ncbi:MAG: AraC family transcriptional regulator [Kineosporiaceae bacterium]
MSLTGIERRRQGARAPEPTTTTLGLLDAPSARPYRLSRWAPPADLADRVERFWAVGWWLPEGAAGASRLLPHPCVNLVVDEHGRALVAGCGREVFAYPLHGEGAVVGVKFRAGAFRAYLGRDVAELTGRTLPASAVWPRPPWAGDAEFQDRLRAAVAEVARELHHEPRPHVSTLADVDAEPPGPACASATRLLADALRQARVPAVVPGSAEDDAGRAVAALLTDPRVRRVGDVAAMLGLAPRELQRLFRRHVGVTAAEVLRRGRMHLVADRVESLVASGATPDWAGLAADLGFADQPHFIREFRAVLGATPAVYAASLVRA